VGGVFNETIIALCELEAPPPVGFKVTVPPALLLFKPVPSGSIPNPSLTKGE